MKCPVCNEILSLERDAFYNCSKGHGILISGKYLLGPSSDSPHNEDTDANQPDTPTRSASIHCPNCSTFMTEVDYAGSGIIIDSCTNCPYRWLDAGELDKIKNRKPTYRPQDWQYLLQIDQDPVENDEPTNINPRIPWFGLQRLWATGESDKTLGAITSMSLYAVVKAWPSKFMRYAILIIILIFGLIYYVVIRTV